VEQPYETVFGAAAVYSTESYNPSVINEIDSSSYTAVTESYTKVENSILRLLIIEGKDLMTLAHSLYELAADEA
jgi:hypothetical protein